MATTVNPDTFSLQASDVSGQKVVKVAGVAPDSTVRELVKGLVPKMGLRVKDSNDRPLTYHVRLEREGRRVHDSDAACSVLKPGDQIVLHPNVMAG